MRPVTLLVFVLNLFILTFLTPVQDVSAEEGRIKVYTLEESIKEALANNRAIKVEKEKIEEAIFKKEQARADLLPKVSMTYGYTRFDDVIRSEAIGGVIPARDLNTQDNYRWKGTVSQTLFSGYALTSAYELAKLGIDQSKIDLELNRLDLALDVKEAYFNILKAKKALDVAGKAVESLESHVDVNRNFYRVGMIPVNDLLKAEVELANAKHDLIKAQNALNLSRTQFNVLLSKPINEPFEVEDILVYKPESPDFEMYLVKALKDRPEIKTLEVNAVQNDEQIKIAKSGLYPDIALTYDYIKEGDSVDVSGSAYHESNSWQILAGLSWVLWDWDKTRNSVREQESLKRQLVQVRKSLEDRIGLELKEAILDLEEAEKNIPTTKKAVEQAEENLRVSEERYRAQVTTSTEVLDAQTLLSQARTNYYNALYDHNLAKAGLLRAVGEY